MKFSLALLSIIAFFLILLTPTTHAANYAKLLECALTFFRSSLFSIRHFLQLCCEWGGRIDFWKPNSISSHRDTRKKLLCSSSHFHPAVFGVFPSSFHLCLRRSLPFLVQVSSQSRSLDGRFHRKRSRETQRGFSQRMLVFISFHQLCEALGMCSAPFDWGPDIRPVPTFDFNLDLPPQDRCTFSSSLFLFSFIPLNSEDWLFQGCLFSRPIRKLLSLSLNFTPHSKTSSTPRFILISLPSLHPLRSPSRSSLCLSSPP